MENVLYLSRRRIVLKAVTYKRNESATVTCHDRESLIFLAASRLPLLMRSLHYVNEMVLSVCLST